MTTTRTYTDTYPEGSQVTLDAGPTSLVLTITEPDPPVPARQPLLAGMEGPAGTQTERIIASYPVQYMREFGVKRTGESLPSLPGWTASKLAVMPPTCRPHVSWKWWDPTRQEAWLDARPMTPGAPGHWEELDTTYYHEPHGDIDPALWRSRASAWANMVRNHPNGAGITTGPVVTRYWLQEGNGDPLAFWVPEADFYGIDFYEPVSYQGVTLTTPWTSEQLFAPALDKVYAALPDGVDILIPEMGRRVGPGQLRADMLASDLEYLRTQHPRVRVVSYFNSSLFPEFAFAGSNAATSPDAGASTPEGLAWKAAMTS